MKDSLSNAFAKVMAYQQQRPAIVTAGTQALNRLVSIAQDHSGQSGVIGRFLIGLYDGVEHPFDLTALRRLDLDLFEDCVKVLKMDYAPEVEVQDRVPNGSRFWKELLVRWGYKAVGP
jgi:hypothetical protein